MDVNLFLYEKPEHADSANVSVTIILFCTLMHIHDIVLPYINS